MNTILVIRRVLILSVVISVWTRAQPTSADGISMSAGDKLLTARGNPPSARWFHHYFSQEARGGDCYNAVIATPNGDVYAGGSSEEPCPRRNTLLLVKYDQTGGRLWVYRDTSDLSISRLMIDPGGCVYAQGGNAILKISPEGQRQWILRGATGGILDMNGNLFVQSGNQIMKLNQEGSVQWVVDSTGTMNVDQLGNLYVSRSRGREVVTAKYSADGTLAWQAQYGLPSDDHSIVTIVVAGSDIVVLGYVMGGYGSVLLRYGSDGVQKSAHNFNTIGYPGWAVGDSGAVYIWDSNFYLGVSTLRKSGTDGLIQWIVTDNGYSGNAIAVDDGGNVIVSWLESYGGRWATAKYAPNGTRLWKTHYSVVARHSNCPRSLQIGSQGRIYVSGRLQGSDSDCEVVQYGPDGGETWHAGFSGAFTYALTVDRLGNLLMAGGTTDQDASIRCFYSQGGEGWTDAYDGPMIPVDLVAGMGLDSWGNCFVLSEKVIRERVGFAVVKYDRDGEIVWETEGACSWQPLMNVTRAGSLVLLRVIDTLVSGTVSSAVIVDCFTREGNLAWSLRNPPQANVRFVPIAIAVDASSSTYTALSQIGSDTLSGILVQKVDAGGNLLWSVVPLPGTPTANLDGQALSVDNEGNVCLHAYRENGFMIKYSGTGQHMFTANLNGVMPRKAVSDTHGSVYIAGYGAENELVMWKFDSVGVRRWASTTQRYSLGSGPNIGLDPEGNVFVVDYVLSGDQVACMVLSYDAAGEVRWHATHELQSGMSFGSPQINIDSTGNVLVAFTEGGLVTAKYSNAGSREWLIEFTEPEWPSSIVHFPIGLALLGADMLFVGGGSVIPNWGWGSPISFGVLTTVCYDLTGANTVPTEAIRSAGFTISQNYPNPFNPSTNIKYDLPRTSHVTLNVYDMLGREVATLLKEEKSAGTYNVQWDASGVSSGVYLYRLRAGDFVQTKRMMIIK